MTPTKILVDSLNCRAVPGLQTSVLTVLKAGNSVTLIDGLTDSAGGYDWQAVELATKQLGWIAKAINGQPTYGDGVPPPPPPLPKPSGSKIGLHILPGGASGQMVTYAQQNKLACVTVVNDKNLANQLVTLVPVVIYREAGTGYPDAPTFDTSGNAYMQGRQWFRDRRGWLENLDSHVYVQFVNEGKWNPGDPDFWRGLQFERSTQASGRKLALFADAVGNPDDSGQSAVSKWQARAESLREAARVGDIAVMHCYSAPGTPAGSLSSAENAPWYEFRYRALYQSVSSDARPRLVLGEAACEFTKGAFQGVNNTVKWATALSEQLRRDDYVVGASLWTVGDGGGSWKNSSIDSALSALTAVLV